MADTNLRYLDRRTFDRYLDKGILKEADLKSHLKNLPDDTANAQWVQMDLHDAEISEEENLGKDLSEEEGA